MLRHRRQIVVRQPLIAWQAQGRVRKAAFEVWRAFSGRNVRPVGGRIDALRPKRFAHFTEVTLSLHPLPAGPAIPCGSVGSFAAWSDCQAERRIRHPH